MTPEQYERVCDAFQRAGELPRSERDALLIEVCAGDDVVLEAARAMLANATVESDPLDIASRAVRRAVDAVDLADGGPAAPTIPGFDVCDAIGSGGMGVVYRARQFDPPRDVAIKVLRAGVGLVSEERLKRESELLARLDHPGIASVFASGRVRPDGSPARSDFDGAAIRYQVMELIDGAPITERSSSLDMPGRLRLVADVCDAVHHAHQRGVIHRDIKASNVLVDTTGRPRVLDFGIALDTEAETPLTIGPRESRSLMGTVGTMSPEQLDPGAVADVRSDVYSLGLLAHNVLSGDPAFDLSSETLAQSISLRQREDPPSLRGRLPAEYADAALVVSHATERDPGRRYRSADALADDLRRCASGHPVEARAPTKVYILSKLIRRNPVTSWAIAAAVLALVGGFVASAVGFIDAERGRREALEERKNALDERQNARDERQNALVERQNALDERQNALAMAGFLEAVVFAPDMELLGADLTFLDAIDFASRRIRGTLIERPVVEAEAREKIGFVLMRQARFEAASDQLRQALRLRETYLGPDHPKTATSMRDVADLLYERDGRYDEAVAMVRNALTILESEPDFEIERAWSTVALGWMSYERGTFNDSREAFTEGRELLRSAYTHGGEVCFPARATHGLAEVALAEGDPEEALRLLDQAIDNMSKCAGQEYPISLARTTKGRVLFALGEHARASEEFDAIEPSLAGLLDEGHPKLAKIRFERARLAFDADEFKQAELYAREALAMRTERLAPDHPAIAEADCVAKLAVLGANRSIEANDEALRACMAVERKRGIDHPLAVWVYKARARLVRGDPRFVVDPSTSRLDEIVEQRREP
ncbi:MAG: serine/threonine-protein kinase [Planctomycetota bacterium]